MQTLCWAHALHKCMLVRIVWEVAVLGWLVAHVHAAGHMVLHGVSHVVTKRIHHTCMLLLV